MAGVAQTSRFARFESFEVDLHTGELRRNGEKVKLPEQSFQILVILLGKRGELVTRQEIQKKLWPNDTVVEFENSINAAVKNLRMALGDSADEPRYVETLARRGYRWLGPIEWIEANNVQPSAEPAQHLGAAPAAAYLLGKKVSHYRVLEILGGGGMGVVYKAEDIKLGRRVALKFLPEELASNPAAMERFKREARSAAALNHPNICTLYAVEEYNGQPFIAMELLEGETLRELINGIKSPSGTEAQTGVLPLDGLYEIAIQIAEGLDAAHQKSIIHRDIKPANIFITKQRQAKILDFGLAKSQESDVVDAKHSGAADFPSVGNLNLTRTGTTIGTAGYMSPEQVRGDKVDARTDLFSFGLVLYEMAVGQRAFPGETIPELHAAILNDVPVPVRQLNPGIPAELERIINKAFEKDRDQRYQSAAEMRAEFARLREKRHPLRWALVGAVAFALVAFALFWFGKEKQPALPEITETQITTSSADFAVRANAISPDGKYLAYQDPKGIHLKILATGEIRTLWEGRAEDYFAWFPDSTRFLVSSFWHEGIQEYSIMGGPARVFLPHGNVFAVSPDGSLVSYTANKGRMGDREIWLIGSDGTNPRLFLSVGEDESLSEPSWVPGSRRITYGWSRRTAKNIELTVETRDLQGGSRVVLYSELADTVERTRIQDFVWLPGGRLILSLGSPDSDLAESFSTHCNLWELRVDPATGQPSGSMRRITNWPGGSITTLMYATADGKKVSAYRMGGGIQIYLADFSPDGKHISEPRLFTRTEGLNHAPAWAHDSQTLFFESNRNGRVQIFRQAISSDIAEPVLLESRGSGLPTVSPDGSFLLYTPIHDPKAGSFTPIQIMRVPVAGGSSQTVLTARIYDMVRCARAPAFLCAIAEPSDDRKHMIFNVLDPLQGRGRELARFAVDPNADYAWDLSPKGDQIAILQRDPRFDAKIFGAKGPIHVLSLNGGPPREVQAKGRDYFHEYVDWAPDGKSLLLTHQPTGLTEVLRVDLEGNVTVLSSEKGVYAFRAVASPDGRHLAMLRRTENNNVWLFENF